MKIVAIIPARLASQRFPRKMLADLGGKPLIVRTYENVARSGIFDRVIVATPDDEIAEVIHQSGGEVFKSTVPHPSGTDRIAEAARQLNADIIVNIQGDEPFVHPEDLQRIAHTFALDSGRHIDIVSFCQPIRSAEAFADPSTVKVVIDRQGFAMYFSRAPIPYARDGHWRNGCKHIGIYAFRKKVLEEIAALPPSPLEQIEKLENLRFLENGYRIKILPTSFEYTGIDTPADLEKARKLWK